MEPSEPNCFARVGINRTTTLTDAQIAAGGKKCVCGALVRFDIATRRAEHFMECPEVERRWAEIADKIQVDPAAVELGALVYAARQG